VICQHANLRANDGAGDDCSEIAKYIGLIDGEAEMRLCPRHAAGWARTVTSGVGEVVLVPAVSK
jgi:hypothetical protein